MLFIKFGKPCLSMEIILIESAIAFTSEVGGANLIVSHLDARNVPYKIYAQGASVKLFKDSRDKLIARGELIEAIPQITEVYLALGRPEETSSWFDFLRSASRINCKIYGVLDNWVDYESRIGVFPIDEYLVFDRHAHEYANSIVSNSRITISRNVYLSLLEQEIDSLRTSNTAILILGGRDNNYSISMFSRLHQSESCVCDQITKINHVYPDFTIILRLHPATQLSGECLESASIQKMLLEGVLEISDPFQSLGAVLARVSIVFGPHGYALFVSHSMGFETYRTTDTNEKWHGPQFPSFVFSSI